ncbi:DNA methyltransferase [Xanthobacteraceae bacterium Astr-EGSB]|uniref:site-specific DNA-methyltransferase n=1 Tax=Astrobacterium formosum TaxID=3069710 RepID=UPI0027B57CFB|nr:DNA methyltransferase [Xanthobacteraceae bacterium Astr-EGSB]
MSRLTDLIAQAKAKDQALGQELEREFKVLSSRRSFGLNFERHLPESVELPGRPVRKGDKVRILPSRGSTAKGDQRLWKVLKLETVNGKKTAQVDLLDAAEPEQQQVAAADLIVVAEFMDYIYPGLVSTGKVERGGDKPFHTVINGENFHAVEALTFTHRGKIDMIYVDPPYNTGAKDWKYNNDYVESEDLYRHSKWLAMIERRLKVARELLNPKDSILVVTIDEKEYLRLGLLLEQTFPEARMQMVSVSINPAAVARAGFFGRSDEYYFFLMFGAAGVKPTPLSEEWITTKGRTHKGDIRWDLLRKSGSSPTRDGHPETFYPFFISSDGKKFHSVGEPIGVGANRKDTMPPKGTIAVWPIRKNGTEGRWRLKPSTAREVLKAGCLRIGELKGQSTPIYYLAEGERQKIEDGTYDVIGKREDGSVITSTLESTERVTVPGTQWRIGSHDATQYGTRLLLKLLPDRRFPFPKSLFAVEDVLRLFLVGKRDALVLDFFAGSGTTAHAVMRINKQDGGRRQSILVTNNEVAADEQAKLRKGNLRPGDAEWEKWGICDYITKPRIEAAITGKTPDGEDIEGDYKFTDEFPMAEGFEENAEFFTLTYETPVAVSHNRAFERIAALLWMRAGSEGRRIQKLPVKGWEVADTYGLLIDLDKAAPFCKAAGAKRTIRIAYIVTDDERRFQSVARRLPEAIEPIRLYESYLTNFRFSMGR